MFVKKTMQTWEVEASIARSRLSCRSEVLAEKATLCHADDASRAGGRECLRRAALAQEILNVN